MDDPLFFNQLVTKLHLGNLLSEVTKVDGGLLHMMVKLDTTSGVYAVKLLNTNVMKRPTALLNFNEADRLENILETNNIPIVPSMMFKGKKIQELDGHYFYVYQWFDGKILQAKDITYHHCKKMGVALSCIHKIDMKSQKVQRHPININWDNYIELAKKHCPSISDLLEANRALLYQSQLMGNTAINNVPAVLSICHNDMDSKNVLWKNDDFRILDCECLSYSNPYLELFECALCWSGYTDCNLDFKLFKEFIEAYFSTSAKPTMDWESIYYSNYGRLEWLEYNVKRALFIECSTLEEQQLGIAQVKETIEQVIYYDKIKDALFGCLHEIFSS